MILVTFVTSSVVQRNPPCPSLHASPDQYLLLHARLPPLCRWIALRALQKQVLGTLFPYIRRTPLLTALFRALGAKLEHDVVLDSAAIFEPDIISIGSNTVVGDSATIEAAFVAPAGALDEGEQQRIWGRVLPRMPATLCCSRCFCSHTLPSTAYSNTSHCPVQLPCWSCLLCSLACTVPLACCQLSRQAGAWRQAIRCAHMARFRKQRPT